MRSLPRERRSVNVNAIVAESIAEVQKVIQQRLAFEIEQGLDRALAYMLGREHYERRGHVPKSIEMEGECAKCGTHQSQLFSRNGGRPKGVLTMWGEIELWRQRLRCDCGGSVVFAWQEWLRPYQRVGEDVDAQIRRWGELRLSLREMAQELARLHLQPLALRTLQQRLHVLASASTTSIPESSPPIVQIDAIWVTQLRPTGQFHSDSKGRRRPGKSRVKRPIFIAMGVWPDTDECTILAWKLAESEDEADWLSFLSLLEELGIRGENGLELIIHDGGSGLCAALRTVFFGAAEQRCLFHKLRNLYNAIRVNDDSLSAKEKRRMRKSIFTEFHAIWQAKRFDTVLRRYIQVIRKFRDSQPEAVKSLRRDFRLTITYFLLAERHPSWPLAALRTTSRLERFNRRLRRRARAASAYHSDPGIAAMLSQELALFHSAQP